MNGPTERVLRATGDLLRATGNLLSTTAGAPPSPWVAGGVGIMSDHDPIPTIPPIHWGIIKIGDGDEVYYRYVVAPVASGDEIEVQTKHQSPYLTLRGPVVVYIEGRAGRVFAEHVNIYVTGKPGGQGQAWYGMIRRDVNTSNERFSIYHPTPPTGRTEADVITVHIDDSQEEREVPAGYYIDVIKGSSGWKFNNDSNGDDPEPIPQSRQADVDDILALRSTLVKLML